MNRHVSVKGFDAFGLSGSWHCIAACVCFSVSVSLVVFLGHSFSLSPCQVDSPNHDRARYVGTGDTNLSDVANPFVQATDHTGDDPAVLAHSILRVRNRLVELVLVVLWHFVG